MEGAVSISQYFEEHSESVANHCPIRKAINLLHFPANRKNLQRLLLFVVLIYFIYNIDQMAALVRQLTQAPAGTDKPQPSDGGIGGHSSNSNGGGRGNEKSNEGGRGGSHDLPQSPSSRRGGSSSSGDNGDDDDPNKKRPTHKLKGTEELMEVESKEESNEDDDSELQSSHKHQMVTNKLPVPPERAGASQFNDPSRRIHGQGGSEVCSNPWISFPYTPVRKFEHSEQQQLPDLEVATVQELTDEEPQQPPPQSAASIGEEQLNFDFPSVTTNEGILDLEQLPFYATIEIESFTGPQSPSQLSQEVSPVSIQAFHADTYYDLAHLEAVQEQVLQAAQATEPFEYTLAFVMYYHGNQLLIPCRPDAEFDPAEDVHVVAVPADCVPSEFTVRINPHLRHAQ